MLLAIRAYQLTLSLDHGPLRVFFPMGMCRYRPSCSMYTYKAVDEYGIIRGLVMGGWRILRCNPWSKGGIDEVPIRK